MNELQEMNENVKHLTSRIAEMSAEHSFEISQKDNFYCEKIKEIEQNNSYQIQTLKKRIKVKKHSARSLKRRTFIACRRSYITEYGKRKEPSQQYRPIQ
jgi:hypothetical protein